MSKTRVLVFPAGEVNSVELHDALATCVNVEVVGASSIDRHGPYIFNEYYSGLPLISDPDFLDFFISFLKEKNIDMIFPTHDTVAAFLASNASKLPAIILGGDARTCAICRDKKKTYDHFSDTWFVPKVYENAQPECLPAFVKPREGQGGQGAHNIEKVAELYLVDTLKNVVCEYLPGVEMTVDCLTDNSGKLRFVGPRTRKRMLGGISVSGQIEALTPEIESIANTINERLNILGLWWFQIKQDKDGQWKLLEISTRCAGSMEFTRAQGVNLPLLSVYTALGRKIEIKAHSFPVQMDGTIIRRYTLPPCGSLYMDFDDTLVIRGKVNLKAIWLIYQCRNKNIPIYLISRHEGDLKKVLNDFHIPADLFEAIYHLEKDELKSAHIQGSNPILVDNSWHDRDEVGRTLGIPVYDVDGIQFLMDWVM